MKNILIFLLVISAALSGFGAKKNLWYVFFTRPGEKRSHVVDRLCEHISGAKRSIDAALYDLNEKRVVRALQKAHRRGVRVRLVMESDNYLVSDLAEMGKEGVPVVHDMRRGLMHDKFFIFDETILWTGSLNITENGTRRNDNNTIVFESPRLARLFLEEFEEMYTGGVFGNRKESRAFPWLRSRGEIPVGSLAVTPLFAPEDDVEGKLADLIRGAGKSIRFMAFSFTSNRLGDELAKKVSEGVEVKGVIEKRGSRTGYSEYIKLLVEGVDIRQDGNPAVMHHKVFIIDDELVVTGSYNFSKGASTRNDENLLLVRSGEVARLYLGEFARVYAMAHPFRRRR